MVKLIKKPWLWIVAIVVSASVWALCFYWVSRTPIEKKFNVWVGAPFSLSDALKSKIKGTCYDHGMDECYITSYDPEDGAYAMAFAMQASSTDVFILHKDEALKEAEAGIFGVLPERYTGEFSLEYVYDVDGISVSDTIGVRFIGDYYVFLGKDSVKSEDLLYTVLDTIVGYGAAVSAESGGQS